MTEISNSDNIIDSRDVIERISDLEMTYMNDETGEMNWTEDDSERAEYESLVALASQSEGYAPDWHHGETLIRDSYFEDYARELADELGMLDREERWPLTHIDWEAAAEALLQDYTSVEFDGVTYWIR